MVSTEGVSRAVDPPNTLREEPIGYVVARFGLFLRIMAREAGLPECPGVRRPGKTAESSHGSFLWPPWSEP